MSPMTCNAEALYMARPSKAHVALYIAIGLGVAMWLGSIILVDAKTHRTPAQESSSPN